VPSDVTVYAVHRHKLPYESEGSNGEHRAQAYNGGLGTEPPVEPWGRAAVNGRDG